MVSVDPGRLGPQPTIIAPGEIPDLSPQQKESLSVFLDTAKRHQIRVPLQTGDILFFNNWALLHRRESYEDAEDTSRHLVRLWLRNSELGWQVPDSMLVPWLAAFDEAGRRVDPVYHIEPLPEYSVPKYSSGSAAFMVEDSDDEAV